MIEDSIKLRRPLFPTPTPPMSYIVREGKSLDQWKRTYKYHFSQASASNHSDRVCQAISTPHPILEAKKNTPPDDMVKVFLNPKNSLTWQPGQWEDMLLTQPPCREATVRFFIKQDGKEVRDSFRLHDEGGITFRGVRDNLRREVADNVTSRFLHRKVVSDDIDWISVCLADVVLNEVGFVG